MRHYELVLIFKSQLKKEELDAELSKIENLITSNSGEVVETSQWGRKEIAFTLKKETFGFYVSIVFKTSSSEIIDRLTTNLRITESLLKFQTHRLLGSIRKFRGNPRKSDGNDEFEDDDYGSDVA